MSRLDEWMKALTTLAQRPTWRLQELPDELLDPDLLTALDAQGWIEFYVERVHRESDSGSGSEQVFSPNPPSFPGPWFSPARNPKVAGTVAEIVLDPFTSSVCAKKYGAKGPCIEDRSELRLTIDGRHEADRFRWKRDAAKPQNQAHTPSPELNATERAIVDALRKAGRRMTGGPLLTEAIGRVDGNGRATLASLVKREVLNNRSDTKPRGYGLPDWE